MNAENKSVEAVCFAAPDGGEKADPSVSPAHLIARLNREIEDIQRNYWDTYPKYAGWIPALRRAIKIIQREFSDELAQ